MVSWVDPERLHEQLRANVLHREFKVTPGDLWENVSPGLEQLLHGRPDRPAARAVPGRPVEGRRWESRALNRIGRGHRPCAVVGRLMGHGALCVLLGRGLGFAMERRWSQSDLRIGILRAAPGRQIASRADAGHSFEAGSVGVYDRENALAELLQGVDPEDSVGVGNPTTRHGARW